MPNRTIPKPPKLAGYLHNLVVRSEEKQTIVGDAEEFFHEMASEKGIWRANLWYWRHTLLCLPIFVGKSIYWSSLMLKNYIKVTFRNLMRHKGFYFINIVGLTIGIICFILIGLFVQDELSYDRYHENADQIYRVGIKAKVFDDEFHAVTSPLPMAKTLVQDFPEVVASVRLRRYGASDVYYEDKVFSEERWFYADETFFDVFTVPFIQGDPKTALIEPNTIVLTRSTALKYFGQDNPMGKILRRGTRTDYLVTGVVEDVPHNSHVHYDFLASLITMDDYSSQNWISNNHHTYFMLKEGTSPQDFEAKLQTLIEKYVAPQVKSALGVTPEEFYASGGEITYFLQALPDIHLRSHLQSEHEPNGDITSVYIFSIVAAAILLIACINFVNLATARSAIRAIEVGIRKTVGSTRSQLNRQFIAEAVFMSFLAVFMALPFLQLLMPVFNNFTEKNLSIPYLESAYTIPMLFGIALVVGILAGVYPAFFLSAFNPVSVLKGDSLGKRKSPWLRNGLVVFQFAISIILIIGTLVMYNQLRYIQNKNLGYDRHQVLIIHKVDDLRGQLMAFKQDLLKYPNISIASNSSNLKGDFFGDSLFHAADRPEGGNKLIRRMWTDHDYIETYRMQLVQGRYFSPDIELDRRAVVLNESAVKVLDFDNPIGQKIIDMDGNDYTVIGVLKDFHFESLHYAIKPMLLHYFGQSGAGAYLSVRINTQDVNDTISFVKKDWQKYTNQAFEYEFFDDHFAKVFLVEEKAGQILFAFSLVAIAIACLGLFGLTSFITERRTKEIGIRKILGAPTYDIFFQFTRQFSRWVLLANAIAWPVAYFVMHRWLQSYVYRTDLEIWIFFIAAGFAFSISMLTVAFQSIKAAVASPVDSLRYE